MEDNEKSKMKHSSTYGGWKSLLGCNYFALASYRIGLGGLLILELVLRFRFLHVFYTDEGTLPISILIPKIDTLYRVMCIHAYSGSLVYQQFLLTIQCILAFSLIIGYKTKLSAILSWYLYLSLTLRNTWLNFILDRYFHHLLFYSMFLPSMDKIWSVDSLSSKQKWPMYMNTNIVSIATIALKAQVFWIYLDAGQGKYNDPLQGWTFHADPLPALDTYARHTVVARYMYALLGPFGLRLMTPTVVWAELLAAPITLLGTYHGRRDIVIGTIGLISSLHIGIAMTVRNTVLLSSVACCAWVVFLPPPLDADENRLEYMSETKDEKTEKQTKNKASRIVSMILILSMISGSVWFETMSEECNQSMKHIWSTLLHNRWNVFIGAEEYVTWEIAPGRLLDGTIVDVWAQKDEVNWEMPGAGAPCTSTSRPGRWRSFPYLAGLEGEEGEALWSYLCKQWNTANNSGRQLLRFNFFMLQADVLPNMGFSATRKRLIHSHECASIINDDHMAPTPVQQEDLSSKLEL